MSEAIDTYWSFRSPYSYLAIPDLLQLRDDYDVDIHLRVVLPLAVRAKATLFDPSNMKPPMYILMDSRRRSEYLGLPFIFPPKPDPIVQDLKTMEVAKEQPYIFRLCKLGVEAERRGKGLDLEDLEAATVNGDHLEEVERNHQALDAAGHWGVPTMVVRGEPFFGQDRIETLRWRLDQFGLGKP